MPKSFALSSVVVAVVSNAALLTIYPGAFIFATIFPNELTFAMSFVLLKLTNILLPVSPGQMTFAVHLIVEPLSLVLLAV